MNPRERFLAALENKPVDRTPLAYISATTNVELQKNTKCFMPEVHTNPNQLVKLCFANHEVLGFDGVTFILNYFNEPAACDAEINWGNEKFFPTCVSHPWQSPKDAKIPKNLLQKEPLKTCIEAIKIAKELYGHQVAVLGKIMGPLSMTMAMHGIEATLIDLIERPNDIKHYLEVASDILITSALAQIEAGADALGVGEGGAGGTMISPDIHREFLLEIHKKIVKNIPAPLIFHICGDITPRLNILTEVGFKCFHFDWAISPSLMKQYSQKHFRIMGNINTTTLLHGTPTEVQQQVKECLNAGVDIISPGCAISPECPTANLKALSTLIHN